MKLFNAFLNDESGAVTVDWVVLTAAIVGLGIAVMTSMPTQQQAQISFLPHSLNIAQRN